MGLISKTAIMKWHPSNKKWYEDRGYIYTKMRDEFEVKVEDLSDGSSVYVEIRCDKCGKILRNIQWYTYKNHLHEDDKYYYCNKCVKSIYSVKTKIENMINNGEISFGYWLIKNLSLKRAISILARWDYNLNDYNPNEITYGSTMNIWLKCSRGLHSSELKNINSFTNSFNKFGNSNILDCDKCNSFEQWCYDNMPKEKAKEILNRWDYELNNKKPSEISFSPKDKYWFKCPKNIHPSELKPIKDFIKGHNGSLDCTMCNSFAQYGYDNIDGDFLSKYWDWERNEELGIDPWKLPKSCIKKVYIFCQEKSYHNSYSVTCANFTNGYRCPFCANKSGKVHRFNSLGWLYPQVFNIWSEKNEKSPHDYSCGSNQYIWWECLDEKHEDYYRNIRDSKFCGFRCPSCSFSKGEKSIEDYLKINKFIENIDYIPQMEFEGLIGLGNGNLSYDFYLPQYNLLIEYQGEQHEKFIKWFHGTKKNFEKQQEHDRRKQEYADNHNIKLLSIWYYDYDNIEEILNRKLNPDKIKRVI